MGDNINDTPVSFRAPGQLVEDLQAVAAAKFSDFSKLMRTLMDNEVKSAQEEGLIPKKRKKILKKV